MKLDPLNYRLDHTTAFANDAGHYIVGRYIIIVGIEQCY